MALQQTLITDNTLITATGGDAIFRIGEYQYHRFNSTAAFQFTRYPSFLTGRTVYVLLIGGGAGGEDGSGESGDDGGPGGTGGGGGDVLNQGYPWVVSDFGTSAWTMYVGAGGAGFSNGTNTSLSTVIAYGGTTSYGAGGGAGGDINNPNGSNGGSAVGSATSFNTAPMSAIAWSLNPIGGNGGGGGGGGSSDYSACGGNGGNGSLGGGGGGGAGARNTGCGGMQAPGDAGGHGSNGGGGGGGGGALGGGAAGNGVGGNGGGGVVYVAFKWN